MQSVGEVGRSARELGQAVGEACRAGCGLGGAALQALRTGLRLRCSLGELCKTVGETLRLRGDLAKAAARLRDQGRDARNDLPAVVQA